MVFFKCLVAFRCAGLRVARIYSRNFWRRCPVEEISMKLLTGSITMLFAMVVGSLTHPFGSAKKQDSSLPLFEGASINLDGNESARRLFQRACANCHSETTAWPWYGYIPPASWMLERD